MKFDPEEVHEAELVSTPKGLQVKDKDGISRQQYLDGLDDELFERNAKVVSALTRWPEVDPSESDPPLEWVGEFGEQEATQMWRVARSAWLSNKEAPVGIAASIKLHIGLSAARAKRGNTTPRQLNMTAVFIELPADTFGRLEPIEIKDKER